MSWRWPTRLLRYWILVKPHTDPTRRTSSFEATISQSFSVEFDYPVVFTRTLFAVKNLILEQTLCRRGESRRQRCLVAVDDGVARAWPGLDADIRAYFHARPGTLELATPPIVVPGGERAKLGWQVVRELMTTIANLHLDRQSFVIAVGGGAMLDMIGFAASIVHRGLRLVRVPTTTLAMDDAGLGVKNGMNEHGQKNFVGTFAPPFAVLNDLEFLRTLPDEHCLGGLAEAYKVAIIRDAAFLDRLCENAPRLAARDPATLEQAIHRCAELHLEHIRTSGDPFEFGSARPLDFGHWAAHKLETMTEYALGHGQAVAIGMAIDLYYAAAHGWVSQADLHRVLRAMQQTGLPIHHEALYRRDDVGRLRILGGLDDFREHLGGVLNVTLPDGLGRKCEVHEMNVETISSAVDFLRAFGPEA